MLKMSKNAMLFNGAAVIIVAATAGMMVRSALFHDDAPPCLDRFGTSCHGGTSRSGSSPSPGPAPTS